MKQASVFCAILAALASNAWAQPTWSVDSVDAGVQAYRNVGEDFLMSTAEWDPDGVDACGVLDDVRCEWLSEFVIGDAARRSNGVVAAVFDGSETQRAIFRSELWSDTVSASMVWWVNYDVHFIAADPADLTDLRIITRFLHDGLTELTLNLAGQAGTSRIQFRTAPQHNWHDTPEIGDLWEIELTLRRVGTGQPAMIWFDNLQIVEFPATLYSQQFPLTPGDTDGDCDVDLDDLATVLASFGQTLEAAWNEGNFDGDADVDIEDLAQVLSKFGEICS